MVSDMMQNRLSSGNFAQPWYLDADRGRHSYPYSSKRRLVEESTEFTLTDLRRIYKRKELLYLAENGRPIEVQIEGKTFSLYLSFEYLRRSKHLYPEREVVRVWMVCPACFQWKRKLYTFPQEMGTNGWAGLKCRRCHQLKHQSANCTGNKWWRNYALPLKKLLKRRQKLQYISSPRARAQLFEIDQSIWMLRERAAYKMNKRQGSSSRTHAKRPYRDLSLVR